MANQPILTLWEMIGGNPVAVSTLTWPGVDRGNESAERTFRVYNNKGATGSAPAKDVLLTIVDAAGGESLELITGSPGTPGPMERAKATTISYTSENELVVSAGGGGQQDFDMAQGGNSAYIATSSVVRREKLLLGTLDNSTFYGDAGGTIFKFIINEAGPGVAAPISFLPATVTADGKVYSTTNWTVDPADGKTITLDPGEQAELPPTIDTLFTTPNTGRYLELLVETTDYVIVASGAPAQIQFVIAPETDTRAWMDYNYSSPDTVFTPIGGAGSQLEVGGSTTELQIESATGFRKAPTIDDGDYAEFVMKFVYPADATPQANIPSKVKTLYNWSA